HNSFGAEYEGLLRQWTSAGYVIAAPDYPLSNMNAPGGATAADLDQQPADARFVIDRVLTLSSQRSGVLAGTVDPRRIGASGHSPGVMTTYRLVYEACCADKRIKAAAPMSGLAGDPPDFFTGISTPLLAEHGDADGTLPYPGGLAAFTKAGAPKFFLTLVGGGHTPPYRGASAPAPPTVAHVTLDFFDRYLTSDRGALERLRKAADPPGGGPPPAAAGRESAVGPGGDAGEGGGSPAAAAPGGAPASPRGPGPPACSQRSRASPRPASRRAHRRKPVRREWPTSASSRSA